MILRDALAFVVTPVLVSAIAIVAASPRDGQASVQITRIAFDADFTKRMAIYYASIVRQEEETHNGAFAQGAGFARRVGGADNPPPQKWYRIEGLVSGPSQLFGSLCVVSEHGSSSQSLPRVHISNGRWFVRAQIQDAPRDGATRLFVELFWQANGKPMPESMRFWPTIEPTSKPTLTHDMRTGGKYYGIVVGYDLTARAVIPNAAGILYRERSRIKQTKPWPTMVPIDYFHKFPTAPEP